MKVNHWGRARKFIRQHPRAERPLLAWKRTVIEANWTNFPEIRRTFNTADWFEGAIIFDIAGNNIRVIAVCRFDLGRLYVDKVMTHKEYDEGAWKKRYERKKQQPRG